jgi:anti-anti-sigma factor
MGTPRRPHGQRSRWLAAPLGRLHYNLPAKRDVGGVSLRPAVRQVGSDRFRVEFAPDRERVVVRVLGEIDLITAGDLERPLLELLASGFEAVVLDLREVSFLDSSGIRVLITAHQCAEERGGHLSSVVGTSPGRGALELSGAVDHLDVS